jgi:hypothetical protein
MPDFRLKLCFTVTFLLMACGDINEGWEVDGGGYLKYEINGEDERTIELAEDDVEVPFIKNSHRYFLVKTRVSESKRGDQFSIMVNRPVLGDNPVVQQYSWFNFGSLTQAPILAEKSIVHFDQKDDSTWTADLDLYVQDCRSGICSDSLPRIHVTGRFRYWIPADER